MSFPSFLNKIFKITKSVDNSVKSGFRFTQSESAEIMSVSKKENLKYFEVLSKMPNLKCFDICFLLSRIDLSDEKIEVIKKAQNIYNEQEFKDNEQTRSDFIFRVAVNLSYLNLDNIQLFKELVKCKKEIYDFKEALENPMAFMTINKAKEPVYAFERVYTD